MISYGAVIGLSFVVCISVITAVVDDAASSMRSTGPTESHELSRIEQINALNSTKYWYPATGEQIKPVPVEMQPGETLQLARSLDVAEAADMPPQPQGKKPVVRMTAETGSIHLAAAETEPSAVPASFVKQNPNEVFMEARASTAKRTNFRANAHPVKYVKKTVRTTNLVALHPPLARPPLALAAVRPVAHAAVALTHARPDKAPVRAPVKPTVHASVQATHLEITTAVKTVSRTGVHLAHHYSSGELIWMSLAGSGHR